MRKLILLGTITLLAACSANPPPSAPVEPATPPPQASTPPPSPTLPADMPPPPADET
jgi:uncharacterized lipoprotein